jgi:hypothetical protein
MLGFSVLKFVPLNLYVKKKLKADYNCHVNMVGDSGRIKVWFLDLNLKKI